MTNKYSCYEKLQLHGTNHSKILVGCICSCSPWSDTSWQPVEDVDGTTKLHRTDLETPHLPTGVEYIVLLWSTGNGKLSRDQQLEFCMESSETPQNIYGIPIDSGTVVIIRSRQSALLLGFYWSFPQPINNEASIPLRYIPVDFFIPSIPCSRTWLWDVDSPQCVPMCRACSNKYNGGCRGLDIILLQHNDFSAILHEPNWLHCHWICNNSVRWFIKKLHLRIQDRAEKDLQMTTVLD